MNKHQKIAYVLIGALAAALVGNVSIAALGEAGSETDPIVTKSYVEKRLAELERKMNEANTLQIAQGMTQVEDKLAELMKNSGTSAAEFKLIQAKNGDVITLGEGSQLILRAGLAKAIAGAGGGLSDLTQGKDIGTDQDVATNHLLLVPKNDGRGIKVLYDSWIMIKGSYQIKN